ncbi:protein of unknown function DUF303 acetylesterase [Emticicia oligotrophica DSM 17448]|uniref:Sialate O-acetylesterase domain-containing protein n=1 Tax=Emticicia oligotrophica (strain DSM 17448 / CIP 109782 / MTCC 6937 / GPTSA100-15) TaxID=929562 RepID=A0ABM5N6Z2_EMTOG|nr:T9SS type A sorting domain-containing protein [Emticicia oligotrophica]AFK05236.1 protein of unknown function DUF303 acetylesterase [Emticicia oligotrophica DSM 17448]
MIIHQYLKHQVKSFIPRFVLGVFLYLACFIANAQVAVVFDEFPKDDQLFQRNDLNIASVNIKGRIFTEKVNAVSLVVQKNNKLYAYQKQKLQFKNQSTEFQLTTNIRAELSEYTFSVYSHQNNDSILLKKAIEVVCGENILVYGQSNALANDSEEIKRFKDEFQYGRSSFANYNSSEFQWVISRPWNHWSAGLLGLQIQRQLIEKYQVPIAIINGSEGNKSIDELSLRDEKQHDNTETIYGRLLKRAKWAEIDKKVRIMVWRQGESEALNPNYQNDYGKKFEKFRKQLLEDFPSLRKIYTLQNNVYFGNNTLAGNLREYQRKIHETYSDCEVMSTIGTPTFDGLHYKLEGYAQNGIDISRQLARDFMNNKDSLNINAPNLKYAYFTAKKDSLILEFDKYQTMVFPKDMPKSNENHPSINSRDYFYLDNKSLSIDNGSANGKYIILKLKNPSDGQKISWLPDNYTFEFISVLPGIIPIRNINNIAALSFKDVPISKPEISFVNSLNGAQISKNSILLSWTKIKYYNFYFEIEKAQNTPTNFYRIGSTTESSFSDNYVIEGIKYYYRIKTKRDGETIYSNIIEINTQNNNQFSASTENLIVFPNPVLKNDFLKIIPLFEKAIKEVTIYNERGEIIHHFKENNNYSFLSTSELNPGKYYIRAILEDNTKLIKKFVVQ